MHGTGEHHSERGQPGPEDQNDGVKCQISEAHKAFLETLRFSLLQLHDNTIEQHNNSLALKAYTAIRTDISYWKIVSSLNYEHE
jgi:hypothetical protein